MRLIYVSDSVGDDSNNGITEATPWKTLTKVNASSLSGDIVHFKCGDTFYGRLFPKAGYESNKTIFKSYGKGKRPIISPYKIVTDQNSWIDQGNNVWRLDLSDTTKYGGNTNTGTNLNYNVGFIKVDGQIRGDKKSTNSLSSQWQFYSDNTKYLYVYSVGNPNSLVSAVYIATNIVIIQPVNYFAVYGLELVGSGAHGIAGTVSNVEYINNYIHEIGGSYLSGTTRYGNGIEAYNCDVENVCAMYNIICDIYDTATTAQGTVQEGGYGFRNIQYKYNTIYNCAQAFEIWIMGDKPNSGYSNVAFEDNICINMGYGWSYPFRAPSDQVNNAALLTYNLKAPNFDVSVKGNIFYNPRKYYYNDINPLNQIPAGYVADYNYIFMPDNGILWTDGTTTYTINQYQDFITAKNRDENSQFHIIDTTQNNTITKITNFLASSIAQTKITANGLNHLAEIASTVYEKIDMLKYDVDAFLHYNKTKTASVSTSDSYAKLCSVTIGPTIYQRADFTMQFMFNGDSLFPRGSVGLLNVQIVPADDFLSCNVALDVVASVPFEKTNAQEGHFVAVKEAMTGTSVTIGIYYNIGRVSNTSLMYTVLHKALGSNVTLTLYDLVDLISDLPAGDQVGGFLHTTKSTAFVDIFDDFLYRAFPETETDTSWIRLKGSDDEALLPRIATIEPRGILTLTSGNSGGVLSSDGSQLVCAIPFKAFFGKAIIEARLMPQSFITNMSINFGVTDTTDLEEPFTISGDTVTAIASDSACLTYDSESNVGQWFACSVNNDTLNSVATGVAPVADTYQKLKIVINENATRISYYVDDVLLKTIVSTGISASINLYAVLVLNSVTTSSRNLKIDYFKISHLR